MTENIKVNYGIVTLVSLFKVTKSKFQSSYISRTSTALYEGVHAKFCKDPESGTGIP
jgi:cation transporter-like permease